MSRLSKSHFWIWFQRHSQEYLEMRNKTKKETNYLMNELTAHLRTYARCLDFVVEWTKQRGAVLTITTNGRARYFQRAIDMVAKAPELPGWTFLALEEPHAIDFFLEREIAATGIDPREFTFYFDFDDPDARYLEVYHPLCTADNHGIVCWLASRAIYNLLGEYNYGILNLDVEAFNSSTIQLGMTVYPLESLPAMISKRMPGNMKIDEQGNLTEF